MSLFSFYDRRVFHIWNAFLQTCKKKKNRTLYIDTLIAIDWKEQLRTVDDNAKNFEVLVMV